MNILNIENKIESEVDFTDSILIINTDSDILYVSIRIHMRNIPNFKNLTFNSNINFFDVFGFNEEFKQLFSALDKYTNLSKQEISDILRKEDAVIVHQTRILLEFDIPKT